MMKKKCCLFASNKTFLHKNNWLVKKKNPFIILQKAPLFITTKPYQYSVNQWFKVIDFLLAEYKPFNNENLTLCVFEIERNS